MPRKQSQQLPARFAALLDEPAPCGADLDRLTARHKLSQSEKVLSGLIYERVEDARALRRIRIKGDQALFAGATTRVMKKRLGVPKGRALADFLPAVTLKAKDFANRLTNASVKRDYLETEAQIAREHVKSNRAVRKLLAKRKIQPELLPAAEDVKKIERRTAAEAAERLARTEHLELPSQGGDMALQIVGPL